MTSTPTVTSKAPTGGQKLLEEPFWIGIIVIGIVLVISGLVLVFRKKCGHHWQTIKCSCCCHFKLDAIRRCMRNKKDNRPVPLAENRFYQVKYLHDPVVPTNDIHSDHAAVNSEQQTTSITHVKKTTKQLHAISEENNIEFMEIHDVNDGNDPKPREELNIKGLPKFSRLRRQYSCDITNSRTGDQIYENDRQIEEETVETDGRVGFVPSSYSTPGKYQQNDKPGTEEIPVEVHCDQDGLEQSLQYIETPEHAEGIVEDKVEDNAEDKEENNAEDKAGEKVGDDEEDDSGLYTGSEKDKNVSAENQSEDPTLVRAAQKSCSQRRLEFAQSVLNAKALHHNRRTSLSSMSSQSSHAYSLQNYNASSDSVKHRCRKCDRKRNECHSSCHVRYSSCHRRHNSCYGNRHCACRRHQCCSERSSLHLDLLNRGYSEKSTMGRSSCRKGDCTCSKSRHRHCSRSRNDRKYDLNNQSSRSFDSCSIQSQPIPISSRPHHCRCRRCTVHSEHPDPQRNNSDHNIMRRERPSIKLRQGSHDEDQLVSRRKSKKKYNSLQESILKNTNRNGRSKSSQNSRRKNDKTDMNSERNLSEPGSSSCQKKMNECDDVSAPRKRSTDSAYQSNETVGEVQLSRQQTSPVSSSPTPSRGRQNRSDRDIHDILGSYLAKCVEIGGNTDDGYKDEVFHVDGYNRDPGYSYLDIWLQRNINDTTATKITKPQRHSPGRVLSMIEDDESENNAMVESSASPMSKYATKSRGSREVIKHSASLDTGIGNMFRTVHTRPRALSADDIVYKIKIEMYQEQLFQNSPFFMSLNALNGAIVSGKDLLWKGRKRAMFWAKQQGQGSAFPGENHFQQSSSFEQTIYPMNDRLGYSNLNKGCSKKADDVLNSVPDNDDIQSVC